jgi:hypothetical protein
MSQFTFSLSRVVTLRQRQFVIVDVEARHAEEAEAKAEALLIEERNRMTNETPTELKWIPQIIVGSKMPMLRTEILAIGGESYELSSLNGHYPPVASP